MEAKECATEVQKVVWFALTRMPGPRTRTKSPWEDQGMQKQAGGVVGGPPEKTKTSVSVLPLAPGQHGKNATSHSVKCDFDASPSAALLLQSFDVPLVLLKPILSHIVTT
jgi:hypothetical protein